MIIEPRVHTNWGNWGDYKMCASGQYVKGMQLRIEKNQGGGDDSALNAIRLTCSDGVVLKSAEGWWGDWLDYTESENKIVGVFLRSEKNQGGGDDSATNGVKFYDVNRKTYFPGNGYWGEWVFAKCPNGSSVIGFRTQVEPRQGDGDDSALNRAEFICGNNGAIMKGIIYLFTYFSAKQTCNS